MGMNRSDATMTVIDRPTVSARFGEEYVDVVMTSYVVPETGYTIWHVCQVDGAVIGTLYATFGQVLAPANPASPGVEKFWVACHVTAEQIAMHGLPDPLTVGPSAY